MIRAILGVIVILLLIGLFVWPGWILGHPIWGPWTPVIAAPGPNPNLPTNPAQPAAMPQVSCAVQHDYDILPGMTELATHPENGWYLHAEFWTPGQPERETILTGRNAIVGTDVKGHAWEYGPNCSIDDVRKNVEAHIQRRLTEKANNAGWADQNLVNELFRRVAP